MQKFSEPQISDPSCGFPQRVAANSQILMASELQLGLCSSVNCNRNSSKGDKCEEEDWEGMAENHRPG